MRVGPPPSPEGGLQKQHNLLTGRRIGSKGKKVRKGAFVASMDCLDQGLHQLFRRPSRRTENRFD